MKNVRGFSLIEVLVALVVLSIGLLGIAALQVDSVRNGQSALQRTRAVNFAVDMADRIRANPGADYDVGAGPAGPEPAPACADDVGGEAPGDCDVQQMADHDIWAWRASLASDAAGGLPEGIGRIDRDTATDPDSWVITVQWTDRAADNTYRLVVQ